MFPRETLTRALDCVSSREPVTTLIDLCRAAQLDVRVITVQ
jgi:hypothetical protein